MNLEGKAPSLSQQHSCVSPEQKLTLAEMVWEVLLFPSQLCHAQDMEPGCMAECMGIYEAWGAEVLPSSSTAGSSCPGPIQRAAQQAPAGLPAGLNICRMEPLLQISNQPFAMIMLARGYTRNTPSPPLLPTPTDRLTQNPKGAK